MEERFKFIGEKLRERMADYAKSISAKGEVAVDRLGKLPDFLHECANQLTELMEEYCPGISDEEADRIIEYARPIIGLLNRSFVTTDELLD